MIGRATGKGRLPEASVRAPQARPAPQAAQMAGAPPAPRPAQVRQAASAYAQAARAYAMSAADAPGQGGSPGGAAPSSFVSGNGSGAVPQNQLGPSLATYGLAKTYGGRQVVRDVSMNVRRGEAVGLLGPNGAGKTTCFYMVTGLVQADAGRIELEGHDVTSMPMYRRARLGIGYLPQEASIFRGLSVEDNIMGVLEVTVKDRARRKEELEELLDEFKIGHVRKSPSIALSGGERRRVEIARALASHPAFMLLDEPFAGIDPIAVGDIQSLVRHLTARGIGVLITDHNVRETLGLIDRAYIIHSGSVLMEGDSESIVSSPEVRRLYLGEEFRL
ncbi:LPS export ABC transporter ATP-binding protein [Xanthobacter sp. TB0136]|uniref:LPS export ABC transporter ATP-binding protein n=1 Tax=Xanthobacter sp. TB0136 TaxID=3459177 RepID=UPI00403955C6